MIGAVLAAVGLIDPPVTSKAERDAIDAAKLKQIQIDRTEHDLIVRSNLGAFHAEQDAKVAKIQADTEAHDQKTSLALADEAKAELLPLFAKWHEQPSRKTALAIQAAIRSIKARVEHELGTELDPVFLATAMAAPFIEADSDLYSVFAAIGAYPGDPINAATALVQHADSLYVTHTEAELTRLEASIEHLARTAPRSVKSDSYVAQHAALTAHAVRSRRAAAVEALRGQPVVMPKPVGTLPSELKPLEDVTEELDYSDPHFKRLAESIPKQL